MRCIVAFLVAGLTTLVAASFGPDILGSGTPAEMYGRLRKHLAERQKIDADGVPCRLLAATLAEKARQEETGKWSIEAKLCDRPFMIWKDYHAIAQAIGKTKLPDAFKRQLLIHHGHYFLFPIRQGPPRTGVKGIVALVQGLPVESTLVTLAEGQTLADAVAKSWPDWQGLTPLQRMLVYRELACINPLVQDLGAYRLPAGKAPTAGSARRADLGVALEVPQMLAHLYQIDPTLVLLPGNEQDRGGDELAVPVGGGAVRMRRFRVPTGAELLLPTADYLTKVVRPERLDLRNAWLCDAALLTGFDPVALDLRGNDLVDLAPLAGMKRLKELRLADNPVTDMKPIAGLALEHLDLAGTRVADIAPIARHGLKRLVLSRTAVVDLEPLAGTGLAELEIDRAPVTDLSSLADLPLTWLALDLRGNYADLAPLEGIATLKTIGDVPKEAWITDWGTCRTAAGVGVPASDCGVSTKKPAAKRPPPPKKRDEPVPRTPGLKKKKKKKSDSLLDEIDKM